MMTALSVPTIAVIGGGFAGAMTAFHVLRSPGPAVRVVLIERGGAVGRGIAYGTASPLHRLNMPAHAMDAMAEEPSFSFERWLNRVGRLDDDQTSLSDVAREKTSTPATYFASRQDFGNYIGYLLNHAQSMFGPEHELVEIHEEAIGLLPEAGRYRIRLKSGQVLLADRVVLALGNQPPAADRVPGGGAGDTWVADPWSEAAIAPLPAASEVLLIGSGLTALDLALSLLDEHGAAKVHLASRRALLPLPYGTAEGVEWTAYPRWLAPVTAPTTVSGLLRRIRQEVRVAVAQNIDWRPVFDALRPDTAAIWRRLPLVERRRFLRHARAYWEIHRHRLPPGVSERVTELCDSGRLVLHAARVRGFTPTETGCMAHLTPSATTHRKSSGAWSPEQGAACDLAVARVIACLGPASNYRRVQHPLALDLIGTGLARPEPLGLGLDVTADGALRDEDGVPSRHLYAVGSLRRGECWESTAVGELRVQAQDVANTVIASLTTPV